MKDIFTYLNKCNSSLLYLIQLSKSPETVHGSDSDGADPQVTYWKNQCFQSSNTGRRRRNGSWGKNKISSVWKAPGCLDVVIRNKVEYLESGAAVQQADGSSEGQTG